MTLDTIEKRLRRASHILAACAILLILLLGISLTTDALTPSRVPAQASMASWTPERLRMDTHIDADSVTENTRGRAVFRSSRIRVPKIVDDSGRFILLGTSIRDNVWRAYVKDTKLKKTFILREGDNLGGIYEVVHVESGTAQIQRGSDILTLTK